jgi:hypothetical protein
MTAAAAPGDPSATRLNALTKERHLTAIEGDVRG